MDKVNKFITASMPLGGSLLKVDPNSWIERMNKNDCFSCKLWMASFTHSVVSQIWRIYFLDIGYPIFMI